MKINNNAFILIFSFIFLSSNASADENSSIGRLEQLSKTLSNGNYTHPDFSPSDRVNVSLKDEDKWYFARCDKDHFNADKKCSMIHNGIIVLILNNKTFIMIGGNHFPHTQSAIKVDDNQTEYGKEGIFKNNNLILSQMLKGQRLAFRFVEWPRNYNVDETIELKGFTDAYHKLKLDYQNIR